jgi:hypothetical protein
LPAPRGNGRKRELWRDVPFFPFPADFTRMPFPDVMSQVWGAMLAHAVPISPIEGVLPLDEGPSSSMIWSVCLPLPSGAVPYTHGASRVQCGRQPTAALGIGQANGRRGGLAGPFSNCSINRD